MRVLPKLDGTGCVPVPLKAAVRWASRLLRDEFEVAGAAAGRYSRTTSATAGLVSGVAKIAKRPALPPNA